MSFLWRMSAGRRSSFNFIARSRLQIARAIWPKKRHRASLRAGAKLACARPEEERENNEQE